MELVERHRLHDTGRGAVDMILLASTMLTPSASIWTGDRRLHALACQLGVAYSPAMQQR
jgi:hypothetical protein